VEEGGWRIRIRLRGDEAAEGPCSPWLATAGLGYLANLDLNPWAGLSA